MPLYFRFLLLSGLFCWFSLTGLSPAQTGELEQKLNRAHALMNAFEDQQALAVFESVLSLQNNHYDALWNTVMLHTSLGHRQALQRDEQAHYDQAFVYAQRLLQWYPDSAGTHFAYAAAVGRKAQSVGPRERIRLSNEIRDHAEKAVALDPEYARAWNVLGVWHHRAANLSRLERMAANALFGGAPEGASNENARRAFRRAMELDPDFILYYHDKAEFLITIGEKDSAARFIQRGLALPVRTSDDERWKQNMRQMRAGL